MDDGIAAAIGGKLLAGTVVSTGYFKDNPSKGNQQFIAALTKKYGDKATISGAAAAAWDGIFMLAHALKSAKSTGGTDVITSLMNAKTSGPRGDLAFKNRHYVSLTDLRRRSSRRTERRRWRRSRCGSRRSPPTRPARYCRFGTTELVVDPRERPVSLTLDLLVAIATLVLVVTGLFLIFGLLHVINLANAGLMAIGVYAEVSFRGHGIGFWPSIFLAALVTGAVGAVIELVVIRRLYARPLDTILATWGISLVVIQGLTEIYGAGQKFLDLPTISSTTILGTAYSTYRLLLIVLGTGMLVALGLIVRFTTVGLTIRAVMANEPLARSHGINTVRVRQLTFIVGAALAGFAGAVLGPIQGVDPNFGTTLVASGFLAVLLSGPHARRACCCRACCSRRPRSSSPGTRTGSGRTPS